MSNFFKKIFSRPVILLCVLYSVVIIGLNYYGLFSAYKQSELVYAVNQYQVVVTSYDLKQISTVHA